MKLPIIILISYHTAKFSPKKLIPLLIIHIMHILRPYENKLGNLLEELHIQA